MFLFFAGCSDPLPEALSLGDLELPPMESGVLRGWAHDVITTPEGLVIISYPGAVRVRGVPDDPAGSWEHTQWDPLTGADMLRLWPGGALASLRAEGVSETRGWLVVRGEVGKMYAEDQASGGEIVQQQLKVDGCSFAVSERDQLKATAARGRFRLAALSSGHAHEGRLLVIDRRACTTLSEIVVFPFNETPSLLIGEDHAWFTTSDRTLGEIPLTGAAGWSPIADVTGVTHLSQTSDGRRWAVGLGVWERVDSGWVRRAEGPRGFVHSPSALGAAISSLTSGRLFDGARRCGSSALSPLLVLDGDCDRWVGLETTGKLQSSWELPTPVFTGAWSVSLAGEDVLIGGEQGVHQLRAGAWVRVETAPTCELTAAAGGWWWTGDGRLCGPRGCRPIETGAWAGPGCHSGRIVADDRGAWIATDEGLLRAELDGTSRRVSTQPTSSVVLDTRRQVLWLLRDGKLEARDPETGDLKQDYPLPYEGSVLAVLRLGAGGELRIERDFSGFQRLQEVVP